MRIFGPCDFAMAKTKRLRNGVGAKVVVYKKFLHPQKDVCAEYPIANKGGVLNELLVVGQGEKNVNKHQQMCVVVRHVNCDDGQLLHTVSARYCKVEQEGATRHIFNDTIQDNPEGGVMWLLWLEKRHWLKFRKFSTKMRQIFVCRVLMLMTEPAPENIPQEEDNIEDCTYFAWGTVTLDERRKLGAVRDVNPSLVNANATLHTNLGYFIHFLPIQFIKTTVIPSTNASLSNPLTWEELLRFLGLILLMVTTQGVARKEFWANEAPATFFGAPFRL